MNNNTNLQNSYDNHSRTLYDKNNEDNNPNNNNTINLTNPPSNSDMTITADITIESHWNTQWQLKSTRDITYASHAHTHCQTINNHYLIGSNTIYTGMGANRIESFVGPEVAQGWYPQEAATGSRQQ